MKLWMIWGLLPAENGFVEYSPSSDCADWTNGGVLKWGYYNYTRPEDGVWHCFFLRALSVWSFWEIEWFEWLLLGSLWEKKKGAEMTETDGSATGGWDALHGWCATSDPFLTMPIEAWCSIMPCLNLQNIRWFAMFIVRFLDQLMDNQHFMLWNQHLRTFGTIYLHVIWCQSPQAAAAKDLDLAVSLDPADKKAVSPSQKSSGQPMGIHREFHTKLRYT